MPEVGVSEEGVYCIDHLPVKFNDPMFKKEFFFENRHEAFILLYFSVVETVVVCKKINLCLCILLLLYKVTNLTLYMYLFIEIS